jgi:aspartate racemase
MGEDRHPEVTMHTHCLGEYMDYISANDWAGVAGLMMDSVRKVASVGADFAICPDNTIHEALPYVRPESPIPWLHIAEVVGLEAQRRGLKRLLITGTKYLMTGPVYPEALSEMGIECEIPSPLHRERIDNIIFRQLVKGEFPEESRLYFNEVIAHHADAGCDAVVLGCTEIPLLVKPSDCPLPTLDSTRLLASAAVECALED